MRIHCLDSDRSMTELSDVCYLCSFEGSLGTKYILLLRLGKSLSLEMTAKRCVYQYFALVLGLTWASTGEAAASAASACFFVDAEASSTFGAGFEPTKALSPGTAYWSSSGNHATDERGKDT